MTEKSIYIITLISFCLLGNFCLAQTTANDIILWDNSRQLTWNDYVEIGNPTREGVVACSKISMTCIPIIKEDSIEVYVYCYFDKTGSYAYKGNKTDKALEHEQGHFNLAEVYTRMLRKKLIEENYTFVSFKRLLSKYYRKVKREWKEEDSLYDMNTGSSASDPSLQNEWSNKIEEQLKGLNAYSISHIVIKTKK